MFCLYFPKRSRIWLSLLPLLPTTLFPAPLLPIFSQKSRQSDPLEATWVHVASLLKPSSDFPSHSEKEPAFSAVALMASLLILSGSGTPWTEALFTGCSLCVVYSSSRYIHGSLSPPPNLCWNATSSTKLSLTTLFKTATSPTSLAVLFSFLFPYSMYLLLIYYVLNNLLNMLFVYVLSPFTRMYITRE